MHKICNGSPETAVDEALEGLVMLHPGLRLLEGQRVVVREKVIFYFFFLVTFDFF